MPEESINIFINNIYSIAIFTGLIVVFFLILFFVSRILIYKSRSKGKKGTRPLTHLQSYIIRSDTGLSKKLFATGLIFISIIFMVLLIMLSMYFVTNFKIDKSLYLIFVMIFLIILVTIYVIRSKIFNR